MGNTQVTTSENSYNADNESSTQVERITDEQTDTLPGPFNMPEKSNEREEEQATLRFQPRTRPKKIIPQFQTKTSDDAPEVKLEVLIDSKSTIETTEPPIDKPVHLNKIQKRYPRPSNKKIDKEVEIHPKHEKNVAKSINSTTNEGNWEDKNSKMEILNEVEEGKTCDSLKNELKSDKTRPQLKWRKMREHGSSGTIRSRRVSRSITERVKSIVENSKANSIVEKTKIEFRKSELTLNDAFKGKRLVDWFLESYKESHTEEQLLGKLAHITCVNLLKIGAIQPCDKKNFDNFNINSIYKWAISRNETPKHTPTTSRRISQIISNKSDRSSELCRNCNRSLNNLDDILFEKIKKPQLLEERSTQTESSFVDEKAKLDETKKDDTKLTKTEHSSSFAPIPPPLLQYSEIKPQTVGPPPPPLVMGPPAPLGMGPPAPPGMGPPPAPGTICKGPPPPFMAINQGPSKPVVKPPKKMRVLHWNRILVPKSTNDGENGKFWLQVSELNLENIDNFVELFNTEKKNTSKETQDVFKPKPSEKVSSLKVLDGKRSQNVGIAIRKLNIEDVQYALYNCKTTPEITVEELMNIEKLKTTDEELIKLQSITDIDRLDAPEAWLLKLSQIDSLSERIFCIVTQTEFKANIFHVEHKISLINSLSKFMIENENLKKLISIILTFGNYLNGGNAQKGQADGFGLDILGKLKDVKSNDSKITLLHFIVKTYIAKESTQNCPIPDPSEVDKATLIDFSECENELNKMKMDVQKCKTKLENEILKTSSGNNREIFKTTMENFIYQAEKKITKKQQDLKECKDLFQKTVDQYCFVLKKSSDVKNPGQFFEKWAKFVSDFDEIYKAEVSVIREKLEKLRKKNKANVEIRMSSMNRLQARISIIQ